MNNLTMIENELVPVYITDTGEKVVYGTELHKTLGVKSKFADWVKNRLNDCDAKAEDDYSVSSKVLEQGHRPTFEYTIKLAIAKEMAMLERNERGKRVRRYFIRIEEKYQQGQIPDISSLSPQTQAIIKLELRQNQQAKELERVNADLQEFKQDIPLLGVEEIKVSNAVKKKGVDCLGGKQSVAYGDNSIRGKVYADIHRQLKREFGVTTYKAIKRRECDLAIGVVEAYELPRVLQEEINAANRQIIM